MELKGLKESGSYGFFFSKLHFYSLQNWDNIGRNRNFLAFEEHDIYDVIMLFNL